MDVSALISAVGGLFEPLAKLWKGASASVRGRRSAAAKKQRGKRLRRVREQCGKARAFAEEQPDETLSPQAFGAGAQLDDVDRLIAVESGAADLSLGDLRSLCRAWNISEDHLLDGNLAPWAHLITDVHDILSALGHLNSSIKQLYPIRVRAPDSHVAFILEGGDWRRPRVLHFTNLHFGSEVGGGGAYDQYQFYLLRAALHPESGFFPQAIQEKAQALRTHFRTPADISFVPSLETTPEKFAELVEGRIHPIAFLHSEFWESRTEWFNFFEDAFHQSPIASAYAGEFGDDFIAVQKNVMRIARQEFETLSFDGGRMPASTLSPAK